MTTATIKVAILMADYGHDPTETAIPFAAFEKAGWSIDFITGTGKSPVCDKKMLEGLTQKLLGAEKAAVQAYHTMINTKSYQNALSWNDSSLDIKSYDLIFLPGGHEKSVRQILDSERAQSLLAEFFPLTKKPSKKYCAAICHGVQALAHSKYPDGKSILHDVTTTALPGSFENLAYWSTRLLLGDYYKTYGAGTDNVEDFVKKGLDNPSGQWKSSSSMSKPFIVEDAAYNYLSGRWPGDAQTLADRVIQLVNQ